MDYNLFRPHMGLKGKMPARAAGMTVPFKDWQDVAQKAKPVPSPPPTRRDWQPKERPRDTGFRRRRKGTL